MSYADFTPFLRPGSRNYVETEGTRGTSYEYRWNNVEIPLEIPAVGELWEDGRILTSVNHTDGIENSDLDELRVSTVYNKTGGGPEETTLEEERFQIRYNPTQLPLIRHKYFQPGEDGDLFTAISGKRPIEDVIGWEYEQNPNYKADRKYQKLSSDGTPTGTVVTISTGQVIAYVKLRQLGFDSFTEFTPVWSRVSIYRGELPPAVEEIGQYVAGLSVPELPSDLEVYDYIKSADNAERVGNQARWQRNEEWTGFTRVYFDRDTMNPAGYTIP